MNKQIAEKKIINKINSEQDSYRVNRGILKIHGFDRAPSPISPTNSSFNNSLFLILPLLAIEKPFPAVTFNLTQRPTLTGAVFKDTPQNILQPATAISTNEVIDNMLGTIKYNSIKDRTVTEIRN